MKRLISMLATGFACTACAAAVEDAQPEPEPADAQRAPPRTPFSARYENPYEQLVGSVDEVRLDLKVPLRIPPDFPDPDPNAEP